MKTSLIVIFVLGCLIPLILLGQDSSGKSFGVYSQTLTANQNTSVGDAVTLKQQAAKDGLPPDLEKRNIPVNSFQLNQNYPNPFNPLTTITFTVDKEEQTSLKIYDISGKLTQVLVDRVLEKGAYRFIWEAPGSLPSGVYFYQLKSGDLVQTRRMFLIR